MTQFTGPEANFIVACLAGELQDQQGVSTAPTDMDWEKLGLLLEKNRLAAHFYSLGLKHPGLFPDDLCDRLRQARYENLLYGDQCRLEVREVLDKLRATGIPVIVMKGWALIHTLYGGDYAQRFCEDIDILIPPDRVDEAEALLHELNYAGTQEVHPGYSRRFSNARAYLQTGESSAPFRKFAIGLHWGLTHYPYFDKKRINHTELFSRSRPLQVAGVDVLEFCPEDQLIYICAHLALHHRNQETLLNYFEIAAIIHLAGKNLDWQQVIDRSQGWGYLAQVQYVLRQVALFWPGVIPTDVLLRKVSWKERQIDKLVANTKGNRFYSALVEFLTMPGIGNKVSATFQQLFPDREFMQVRYCITPGEKLLPYYFKRLSAGLSSITNPRK
jgi:hypothetical protein